MSIDTGGLLERWQAQPLENISCCLATATPSNTNELIATKTK